MRAAGLKVKTDFFVYRILTRSRAEVEAMHRIVKDPDHSPDFVNGDSRIYLAMLTGELL